MHHPPSGFGNCCTYIPSHVLSGLYYDKYRSVATGVSTSGSGLGAAVFPVLVGFLIDVYSWRGSLILLAGLNLHLFIFSALLRYPPEVDASSVKTDSSPERVRTSLASLTPELCDLRTPAVKDTPTIRIDTMAEEQTFSAKPVDLKIDAYRGRQRGMTVPKPIQDPRERPRRCVMSGSESYHGKTEYENFAVSPSEQDGLDLDTMSLGGGNASPGCIPLHTMGYVNLNLGYSTLRIPAEHSPICDEGNKRSSEAVIDKVVLKGKKKSSLVSKQKMSLDTSSNVSVEKQRLSLVQFLSISHSSSSRSLFALASRGSTVIYYEPTPHLPVPGMQTSIVSASTVGTESSSASTISALPMSSRHIYIFTNYGFNIYFLSNIMWNASYAILQSFGPEFLLERGLTLMEAAWLSGAFGLCSFVGGVVGGVVGNIDSVDRQRLYTLACLMMGVAILGFPLVHQVTLYAAALVVAGLALGIILGLLIVVLTDLVGAESLGNGLGYLMLSNGVGAFLGPPLASTLTILLSL